MDKKIEILLVEDNPGDAGLIEDMLEEFSSFPYELKNAVTLNEGLNLLKENSFDVILTDLGLPDSDGIDTFLEIHARNSRIPIIILTGMNDERIGINAVKQGAQDYLVKGQVDGKLLIRSIQYSIERKKSEEKIKNLANVVESSNDAIITKSLEGIITSWNKGAEQIYRYSAEETLGKPANFLIPSALNNESKRLVEMVKRGEKVHQYETSRLRKDGRIIDVSMTLSPIFDISGELAAVSIIARDITESKKAEERLQRSEERYRIIAEQTGQLIYEYDTEDGRIYWAGAIEKVTGYTQEELMNIGIELWINNVHPDDQIRVWNQKMNDCTQNIKNAENKRNFHLEYRFRRKDGEYIHIEEHVVCLQKGNYLTNKVFGIMKDITERKKAENVLKRIEEARKKEIHHRIKNNLQVISSLLDLQAEKFAGSDSYDTSKVLAAFKDSQNRVISMALIHEELYGSREVSTLNFGTYLQKLTEDLFRCYSVGTSGINLCLEIEENTFFDMDTAVPLGMVVNELVSNSLKHAFPSKKSGEIRIKLSREENRKFENDKIEGKNEGHKSKNYILTISDNGAGIPESLNIEDSDTLGIQLVTILVDQLDGVLELNRTSGTEFIIEFSVAEKQQETYQEPLRSPENFTFLT
ncbi:MAG: PAS domain S-box protein [Methanosarcina flavescens]|jgi:PAS domain S-box-containing protein|uniref:PAS domain S-box protein n=1 Tax=Methanosarcina flavescens TaxID=1715806 RepID=A0A660HTS6_9EURY|nr:PAS domain S-box protein [Methanosarcina flavescens]AYK15728.1 PAS domain S-box protein [Methanosarcina flavescens]NLK31852.1 PAS domain S-box protein [Methanosarcina flavescens]